MTTISKHSFKTKILFSMESIFGFNYAIFMNGSFEHMEQKLFYSTCIHEKGIISLVLFSII